MIELKEYGFKESLYTEESTCLPARITAVHKDRYELVCREGQTFGRLKASQYYGGSELFPTVGDFVLIDYLEGSDSRIVKTLERASYFSRMDPSSAGHWEQAVASNFDYVFIVQSLNQDFNVKRLERYVTLAWQSGALPVIILTKADLAEDYEEHIQKAGEIAAGVDVLVVSSKTGFGLEEMEKYKQPGKTIVFLGSSGVGKSSLLNALAGREIMEVNTIREDDDKGRHTTTHRQLIMLENGTMVIDTPGMRELGMWDVSEGLGQSFGDVEQYFANCRFNDCQHSSEPGCAVKAAIESGELPVKRWNSYLKLKREAKYTEKKENYMQQKQKWSKSVSKYAKQLKKKPDFSQ